MAISFDHALGVLPETLHYRTQRAEVLSSNIANVDTPDFKAKDLDFNAVLGQQKAMLRLGKSNTRHLSLNNQNALTGATLSRKGQQLAKDDGNTVELGLEQAAFMRNSMEFQTSLTFLNMKFKGLHRAINGQ